ncbi:Myb/SANT-like DNA-binding domain [Popillia japonica]|uniref:Myb/SANT-like DNA-binding domain n=1 Tax=Popillia japonica TaxID=7064 RepID=A0AAW1HXT4_POPJA
MRKMWETISEEFKKHDFHYTAIQVESKWKTLERSFKTTIENSKKTGRGKRSCPYERELAAILLKRNSVIPPCVLDENSVKNRASSNIIKKELCNSTMCT